MRGWRYLIFAILMLPMCSAAHAGISLALTGAGQGADALTDANSWFAFPGETKSATIQVTSTGSAALGSFSGLVRISADCCVDTRTGQLVHPKGFYLSFGTPSNGLVQQPGPGLHPIITRPACVRGPDGKFDCPTQLAASAIISLNHTEVMTIPLQVSAWGDATPGRYTVTLVALSYTPSSPTATPVVSNNVFPVLNILPALAADTPMPAACPLPPGGQVEGVVGGPLPLVTEALSLQGATRQVFDRKAASPTQTSFHIGAATAAGPLPSAPDDRWSAWNVTIDPPPAPLPPNKILFVFKNSTQRDKEAVAFTSPGCPHAPMPRGASRVLSGMSTTITLDTTTATSLLLRRQVCGSYFLVCWDNDFWEDVAIFSEPNVTTLFGGRMVTIEWFYTDDR